MWWIAVALGADCVSTYGTVDLPCLGSAAPILLTEHSVGGPGGKVQELLRSRYATLASCLSALPVPEGAVRYELPLDPSYRIVRIERDPVSTVEIDACVEQAFVGAVVEGATDTSNRPHFTLSFRRPPSYAKALAADLGRLCEIAGRLQPGAELVVLVTEWGDLAPETAELRKSVETRSRSELYQGLVDGAAARGVTWSCPALERVLGPP